MRLSISGLGVPILLVLALGCSKGQDSSPPPAVSGTGQKNTFKIEDPKRRWFCPFTIQLDSSFKKVPWTKTDYTDMSMGMDQCFVGADDLKITLSSYKDGTIGTVAEIEKSVADVEATHPERVANVSIPGGHIYEFRLRQTKPNRGHPYFGFFHVVKGKNIMNISYYANDEPDIALIEEACKTVQFL